jgi:hypothetical protein
MNFKSTVIAAFTILHVALPPAAFCAVDALGVAQVYATDVGGKEWLSKWNTGVARTFTWGKDPQDPWFDAKGNATYAIDGKGLLKISGSTPRLYVHDPLNASSWRNVEMTVYAMRVADDSTAYAGIVAIARTNHGITGSETANLCDTRGYGGRMRLDGKIDFDKETSHPSATAAASKRLYPGGLPANVWIGYKYVVYDLPDGNVKLEMWRDTTDGLNGGTWVKVNEFTDTGANFGVGAVACKAGINPALRLTNSDARAGSESGKPNIAVYWRSTNIATNGLVYKKMTVREIRPGVAAPADTAAPLISAVVPSGVGRTGATISWTTNENADTMVDYGPTSAYGASTPLNATLSTGHSAVLGGLAAATVYHYRAKSRDAAGNLAVSADYVFTTNAASALPPPVTGGFYDNFSTYVKNFCFPDGYNFGPWTAAYSGYGCIKTATAGTVSYVEEAPKASTAPAETHASMILGPNFSGPLNYSLNIMTVAQLRTGSAPNPWEVAWVAWNYTDNTHFYYLALKPNGWELGKEDPAYPGAQRFLATGSSPIYPIANWYHVRIVQDAANVIKIYADDRLIASVTDTERPYTSGRIGFYSEDAQVRVKDVAVNIAAPVDASTGVASGGGLPLLAPQKLLSPSRADGINDAAVFGAAAAEVSVYDINGKSVFHSAQQPIIWNGRDGAGRVVESGVYIARIRESGAGVVFQSFVVAK